MLNQILKFTLVSSLLLWLRPRWRGLLALAAFVLLVHVLHGEYLAYVELSDNDGFLVWSFVLKWTALALGVLAYFLLAVVGLGRGGRAAAPVSESQAGGARTAAVSNDDGFDFLRDKKELQGKAGKLLTGKPSK